MRDEAGKLARSWVRPPSWDPLQGGAGTPPQGLRSGLPLSAAGNAPLPRKCGQETGCDTPPRRSPHFILCSHNSREVGCSAVR